VHVAMLTSFLAAPRERHLAEVLLVFAYLKKYKWSTMVFDGMLPIVDESLFAVHDWSDFYQDALEEKPINATEHLLLL
jgi:hypothetical protein